MDVLPPSDNHFLCDSIKPFLDQDGLMGDHAGVFGGNGLLYLSEFMVQLKRRGALTDQDRLHYRAATASCYVAMGCYQRSRVRMNADNEGPDDYVGLAAGSAACDPFVARWILLYGRNNPARLSTILADKARNSDQWYWWALALVAAAFRLQVRYNYNNLKPSTDEGNQSSWMGRQPQLVAHMQFAAGESPALWRKLFWFWAVATAYRKPVNDTDSRKLSYLLVVTAEGKSLLCGIASWWWWRKLRQQYAGGMKQVYGIYFGENHPITLLCQD